MAEDLAPADESKIIKKQQDNSAGQHAVPSTGGTFACSFCSLKERYDYKGAKPPFARQLLYLEQCYIIKDPFSLPNKGEVLVLGSDCSTCKRPVCLGCSVFYSKRFCPSCAAANVHSLPFQLHSKIGNLPKPADT